MSVFTKYLIFISLFFIAMLVSTSAVFAIKYSGSNSADSKISENVTENHYVFSYPAVTFADVFKGGY